MIVPFTERVTATFWKVVVSGHFIDNAVTDAGLPNNSPYISELTEAVFRGGRVTLPDA
jgi:hypothetical protein